MIRQLIIRIAPRLRLLLCWLALTLPATAHEDLTSEIRRLNAAIALAPTDAQLVLRRGEINRLSENWAGAFADFYLAEKLDPKLAAVSLARGRAAYQTGRLDRAKQELDQFIRRRPSDPAGFALRARVLVALGRWTEANRDFSIATGRAREPDPDDYLEWARALGNSGDDARAVRVLDAGLRKLGPVISLALPALALEEKLGRLDAALRRLAAIAATAQRQETWLAKRGAILAGAGRAEEARAAYRGALAALAQLPDARRNTRSTLALEAQIKSEAACLESP